MWTVILTFPAQTRATVQAWEDGLDLFEAAAASVPGVESTLTLHHADAADVSSVVRDCVGAARRVTHSDPTAVEAMRDEMYERRANAPTLPSLVSAPEVGELLGGISRQRVYQLQQNPAFPEPLVRLRTGPVWDERAIARFASTWDRKPGRRPKLTAAG